MTSKRRAMHPASKRSLTHLRIFLENLKRSEVVYKASEIVEEGVGYSFKIQPSLPMLPIWHFRVYIQEEI
jgi:hypothetical protein